MSAIKPEDIFEIRETFSLITVSLKFKPECHVQVEGLTDCGHEEETAIGLLWNEYGQEIIDFILKKRDTALGLSPRIIRREAAMKCKIFYGRNREGLQDSVNKWLETHFVESFNFQFSSVYLEDPVEHIIEHTLVLFYIPRVDEQE